MFRGVYGPRDADRFDQACVHVLIEDAQTGRVVCCFRLLAFDAATSLDQSYSAQFYDLSGLTKFHGKLVEMGRFCIDPRDLMDPDILRVAWGAVTHYVDEQQVALLFGCSSFEGTEVAKFGAAFALLRDRHLAPARWLPQIKADEVVRFSKIVPDRLDEKAALRAMPPLLRTYLMMGGWVSDHAVVDRDLNTMHVFTGLEINAIPATRARLLRAVAGAE